MPDLLTLWLDMLERAETGDRKAFASAQAVFSGWYKKSDYQRQGDFHARLRGWYAEQGCACGA